MQSGSTRTALLVLSAFLTAATAAEDPASPAARDEALRGFEAYLGTFREQHRIPALSAAILRDGEIVWEQAYGWSDDEAEVPATLDTTFSIASVTKPIAAAAIIAEAEAGALDLDTPMSADPDWAATCEWLSHSEILFGSGGKEADGTPVPGMDCTRTPSLADMLNMRANGDGERFVYNPISYARIDRVIRGAGGRELRDIVRERAIDPAGIHDLALGWRDPQGGSALRLLAPPFAVEDGKRRKNSISDDDFRAAAGIKASVRQLAQFDQALDAGKVLSTEWMERIFEGELDSGDGDYRWGWFVQDWQGQRLAWHSGWDPQRYSAMYLKLPAQRLSLIVLANTEALWWDNSLVRAEIETSAVAAEFLRRVAATLPQAVQERQSVLGRARIRTRDAGVGRRSQLPAGKPTSAPK